MSKKKGKPSEYLVWWIPADDSIPMELKCIGTSLDDLRKLVGGGWIEIVRTEPMPRLSGQDRVSMVVDEEGLIKNLPVNRRATKHYYPYPPNQIHGDAFLIGEGTMYTSDGPDRDFLSLPINFRDWKGPGNPVPGLG